LFTSSLAAFFSSLMTYHSIRLFDTCSRVWFICHVADYGASGGSTNPPSTAAWP
jgi:hypothetical protein